MKKMFYCNKTDNELEDIDNNDKEKNSSFSLENKEEKNSSKKKIFSQNSKRDLNLSKQKSKKKLSQKPKIFLMKNIFNKNKNLISQNPSNKIQGGNQAINLILNKEREKNVRKKIKKKKNFAKKIINSIPFNLLFYPN